MTYTICYWDEKERIQKERDSTPEEDAQRTKDIADAAAYVPQVVAAIQGLLALDKAGYAPAYEQWANDPKRTFTEKAFINRTMNWRRDDAVLNAGAVSLGLSSQQLDQLFRLASTL